MSEQFTIKLPVFEGPFDLLLFFIERDELDIYNIPIATITDDFLAYIHQLETLNIDVASEFIVVAATLMRIKAKMLLPRKPVDEEGNEIDPRMELVERLLEYKRYKSVLDELRKLEEIRSYMLPRGNAGDELKKLTEWALAENEMESITMYRLLKTFQKVLERYEDKKRKKLVHRVYNYDYTIQGQKDYLFSTIKFGKKTPFVELFESFENRIHAIVTFLALLELLNLQQLAIVEGEGINNFWLTRPEESEQAENDEVAEEENGSGESSESPEEVSSEE